MTTRVTVAGAGMAGLVAAARIAELGGEPVVYEKGDRPGGSMRLSSGVIWRHREFDAFRQECPTGIEALQHLIWERLDDALRWLQQLGAPVVGGGTGNPDTAGVRFDPVGLTDALVSRLPPGALRLATALPRDVDAPLVLATGGFAGSGDLVERFIHPAAPLPVRGNPWSDGEGLRRGVARGAATTGGMDEFYGRNLAVGWQQADLVGAAQVIGRHARIFDEDGVEFFQARDVTWSETNLAQATARRPGGHAFYLLTSAALDERVRGETVADIVNRAPSAARPELGSLPFPAPEGIAAAVHVEATLTHTIGGLRVDRRARVLDDQGDAIPGLFAAGVDAGGVATGGYASGLAQALVLGLVAAEATTTER